MSYIIQYSNGQYLSANKYETHTNNVEEAYSYINLVSIQRAIEDNMDKTNIERFRGARILTKAGEYIRYIRLYKHCFRGIKITKETDKAILVNSVLWIPKSQCQIENNQAWISKFIWNGILEKYGLEASKEVVDIDTIITK